MIINRNIIVKRAGNKLLLPTVQRKEVNAPINAPSSAFAMCRIVSYDQNSGTIGLKLFGDFVGEPQFKIAIEEN